MAATPPVLDFSVFYGSDQAAKSKLVQDVKRQCLYNGFFQIIGHQIPSELRNAMFKQAKVFFNLPLEEKLKTGKNLNNYNRGYEVIGSQILEAGTLPELKEGFNIGDEISVDHPYFLEGKLNSGPNLWPETMTTIGEFRSITTKYYYAMRGLANDVLRVLAATLDLPADYFEKFATDPVATMRMMHYPPQPADADEKLSRGIGAHTDFGALTLLMQDAVGGLQVWEKNTQQWIDVAPVEGAYVVNLGNLFMRWSDDRYISNLHRVINKSGKERYSIAFFFSGNPDFVIDCLPNCRQEGQQAKYPPVNVETAINNSAMPSYRRAAAFTNVQA